MGIYLPMLRETTDHLIERVLNPTVEDQRKVQETNPCKDYNNDKEEEEVEQQRY